MQRSSFALTMSTLSLLAALPLATPVSAEMIVTDHVFDGTIIWQIDTTTINIGGIPVPVNVPRRLDFVLIQGINEAGDVLLSGQLKDNQYRTPDLNYTMYSVASEHDGRPDVIEHDKMTSRVAGLPVYLNGVDRYLLPDQAGYIIANGIDRSSGPGNYADTTRIEYHTNLSGDTPTFMALGYFNNQGSASVGALFPFALPGAADLKEGDLISTNRAGDQFVFNVFGNSGGTNFSGVYEVMGTGPAATVTGVRTGDILTVDGQPFQIGLTRAAFSYQGRSLGLVAAPLGTANIVLLGRNPTTGEYYHLSTNHNEDSLRYDTTANGFVAYDRSGLGLTVADLNTGQMVSLEGQAISNVVGATLKMPYFSNAQRDGRPVFDAEGNLLTRGYAITEPTNQPVVDAVAQGIFKHDMSSGVTSLLLAANAVVGDTGFSLTGFIESGSIKSFTPHVSGILAIVGQVVNADQSVSGDALIVLDPSGNLIPVIMPGDTFTLANNNVIGFEEINGLTASLGDVNQKINADGLAAISIVGSDGATHVFTVQLPIPEPASIAIVALGGISLLGRRKTM